MSQAPLFIPLPDRAVIAVEGPEAKTFLQAVLTQDLDSQAVGELRWSALLTPQGRLIADLFVLGTAEGVWLDVPADQRDDLIRKLTLYRLRARATILARDDAVAVLLDGQAAPGWRPDPRRPELGLRGYGLAAPAGAVVGMPADYDARRIALAVPDMTDLGNDAAYPIEANLDLLNAIDFQKGCFVGQETTSRMKRRGQIKTRLLPLIFEGAPPPPGTEVLNGDLRAGVIKSGVAGKALALLRLDRMDGDLTADGRPVAVRKPAWIADAI